LRDGKHVGQLILKTKGRAGDGYHQAQIYDKCYTVHTLVAAAWKGPRLPGQVVRHLDDDPSHNWPANLEYGTQRQNLLDVATNNGRAKPSEWRRLKLLAIIRAKSKWTYDDLAALAAQFGVCADGVQKTYQGRSSKIRVDRLERELGYI
jgi:hypothetical protein